MERKRKVNMIETDIGAPIKFSIVGVDKEMEIGLGDLSSTMVTRCAHSGLKVKITRAASGKQGLKAFQAMEAVGDSLKADSWLVKTSSVNAEKEGVFNTLLSVPENMREAVIKTLIESGSSITMEECQDRGII